VITLAFVQRSGPLPTDEYAIISDTVRVGTCRLRHTPSKSTEAPAGFESHVAIEIESEYRNQGYGTSAMRLICDKARELGMTELFLTIQEPNVASQTVARKNGAKFVTHAASPITGVLYNRYRIEL
jgi:predicted acetyltransferase